LVAHPETKSKKGRLGRRGGSNIVQGGRVQTAAGDNTGVILLPWAERRVEGKRTWFKRRLKGREIWGRVEKKFGRKAAVCTKQECGL